ncbi:hypothetical protein [Actinomadura oligospora]|nr:hypothetical protein [Actinomadura oligospora]
MRSARSNCTASSPRLERTTGFHPDPHETEVHGVCASCLTD